MARKKPRKNKKAQMDNKLKALQAYLEFINSAVPPVCSIMPPVLMQQLTLMKNAAEEYLSAEEERNLLRRMVEKIFKPLGATDRIQDRRDLLRGFIYHIERSLVKYPTRWKDCTHDFLVEQKKILTRLECDAELEFWVEFDK